ncbi:hypothetical protein LNV23_16415 [Paucibacter sp. DJ1R-11]|uniref:hypothetical protein n=1 Tax=Paucibacter sp. DJ1R-11 TaxID=2893556 RepID=UPI0021E43B90|nr:hypothetical protein [Paucibacter sp. DJ1R-11]MCV2365037.1 hypothetical protein [Paucibacter sp. DJ1R-11]
MIKHFSALCMLMASILLSPSAAYAAQDDWPRWQAPGAGVTQLISEDMLLNGRRSRLLRMDLPEGMDAALKFFKERLGPQHVLNQVQGATVLAGREGQFFHTVQLRQGRGEQVVATVMSSRIEPPQGRSKVQIDTERLLPADSALLQTMESRDQGRRSLLLSASNQLGLAANQAHILQQLKQSGLQPVKEDVGAQPGSRQRVTWLQGPKEEAMVSIVDRGDARLIVIQRTQGALP